MMIFIRLQCLLLLINFLLVKESSSCSFEPGKKLKEFNAKIQRTANTARMNKNGSPGKLVGRVAYPILYGADPSGVRDSSGAILNAINDAFGVQSGSELLPGVKDLGGVVIDLQGGNFIISQPLRLPAGVGNVVIQKGTLRASPTFRGDRHLIELWSPNSQKIQATNAIRPDVFAYMNKTTQNNVGIYYEDITFRDILFDSSYRGGGIYVVDSARIRIDNCFFIHFTTQGVKVRRGHETFISNSFLGQHLTVGGDKGEKHFSGTGIDLVSNDNAITDVAIFSGAIGIILSGQANILTGVHCYNKATYWGGIGIYVKLAGNSVTRINNCYMDYTAIVMEDPVQVHVSNGFFLGDANIVLKSVKGQISGLNIVDNMFTGDPNHHVPIVKLDGKFTNIDQVVVDRNNVRGMSLRSTVAKISIAGKGTKWVADFSNVLLFPNKINHIQDSFYIRGGSAGFPLHFVTGVANNAVVVESDKEVDAVVSIAVDQYNMAGETSSYL